jgi:uncharacterized membrane protein (DUF4010 family)
LLCTARTAIVLSITVVTVRLTLFTVLISPAHLRALGPLLLGAFLMGLLFVVASVRGPPLRQALEVSNPGELRAALIFAAVFAAVQFGAAWLEHRLGDEGLLLASMASGAVDLDAIALSLLHRPVQGAVESAVVARCLAVAFGASLVSKMLLALVFGGRALARALLLPFAAISLGLTVALELT